jgi:putative Ca2+/H+ antiporter (TMEM165/GDT1 family)
VEALLVSAGLVFVAELGDKTQLVALGLATRYRLAPVLAGITLAYAVTNLLSVIVGGVLGAALPTRAIGVAGGLLFLVFAWRTWRADDEDGDVEVRAGHVVRSIAGAMIVAELGDKTMLTAATLAARDNPVLVWVGATVGIVASGAIAVVVGRALGNRLPARATRLVAAVLFAGFGAWLLVSSVID